MIDSIQKSQLYKVGIFAAIAITIALFFILAPREADNHHELAAKLVMPEHSRIVGGLGESRGADDEVNEAVQAIKSELEAKTNKKFESIHVLEYKRQTVAGVNFFVKAKAKEANGPESLMHLRIYRNIGGKIELSAHQTDKKLEDRIEYFQ